MGPLTYIRIARQRGESSPAELLADPRRASFDTSPTWHAQVTAQGGHGGGPAKISHRARLVCLPPLSCRPERDGACTHGGVANRGYVPGWQPGRTFFYSSQRTEVGTSANRQRLRLARGVYSDNQTVARFSICPLRSVFTGNGRPLRSR